MFVGVSIDSRFSHSDIWNFLDILDAEMMQLRHDRCIEQSTLRGTLSMALLRGRSLDSCVSLYFNFSTEEFDLPLRGDWYRRLEDCGDGGGAEQVQRRSGRDERAIGSPGRNQRFSRIHETRIVLHNFRLASRSEELQLLSSSTLRGISPLALAKLSAASIAFS